jgi:cation diffusion facilitator CzcD-associated flavoprotein CzcO
LNAESSELASGLQELEARLAQDLSYLELPSKDWVPASFHAEKRVLDVAIIGAGMCGLVAAAALRMIGIHNVICLDRSQPGLEGPWKTFARMETLRSPKQLTGPALGLPSLTFRAWFVAQFGAPQWDSLDKIPREMWMDYLVWYRKVLDLPVRNRVNVREVRAANNDLLELHVEDTATGSAETIWARHVVLATGRDGLGGSYVPGFAHGIDRNFWAHSADEIDFDALKGKRIAVIGAGASAMDNAATALEAGAASVDLIIRRKEMPRVNKFTGISSQGVVHGFVGLSDEWKWKFLQYTLGTQTPPPRDSTLRVSRRPNARFYLGTPTLGLTEKDGSLRLETPHKTFELDFVIFATGFDADLDRPELHYFAPFIKLWSDAFTPPAGKENAELARTLVRVPGEEGGHLPGATPLPLLQLSRCLEPRKTVRRYSRCQRRRPPPGPWHRTQSLRGGSASPFRQSRSIRNAGTGWRRMDRLGRVLIGSS